MALGDLVMEVLTFGNLSTVDIISILVYLLTLAGVTIYVNYKVGGEDSEHYFLGGRDIPWWAIGFSLFASNLGTDHLVGLAGSGAAQGLAVGCWEWSACFVLLVLGWVFVPHYLELEIFTVPEYLERRFNRSFRTFFTWLTIATTLFTKISVTIFAGSVVMQEVLGWNKWVASISLLGLTGVYTTIGGLAAVVYTEVLQSIVLLVGCMVLLWYGLDAVGGWSGMKEKLPAPHFDLMKPSEHQDFPWLGVILGMPISGVWYWCTDQVMVQRVLAAKSVSVGQSACTFAGWLKLTPMFIMVVPGMIAAALYPQEIAVDSNRAFALLVARLLPPGWQGPMIAVMLSSFMAALASCFNSVSTLFTMDLYAKWYPDHTEEQLVHVGRVFTVAVAALSLAWLPIIEASGGELFLYIMEMQTIWCGSIAAVFLVAATNETVSAKCTWLVLGVGISAGFIFWLLRKGLPPPLRWEWLSSFCVLYFSILQFLGSVIVLLTSTLWWDKRGRCISKSCAGERTPLMSESSPASSVVHQGWAGIETNTAAVGLMVALTTLAVLISL